MKQILELDRHFISISHPNIGVEVVGRQSDSVRQIDTVRPVLLVGCYKRRRVEMEHQLEAGALLSLPAADELPSTVPGETMRGHLRCAVIGWGSSKIRKDLRCLDLTALHWRRLLTTGIPPRRAALPLTTEAVERKMCCSLLPEVHDEMVAP